MRRCLGLSFVFVSLLFVAAGAQEAARPSAAQPATSLARFSHKAVRFLGTVSDDGKSFLADPDAEVWTIVNPESVGQQRGQQVSVQGQINRQAGEIRVLCVKPHEQQVSSAANFGDAAFRR